MTSYDIVISPIAAEQIAAYGFYIAKISGQQDTADRWVDHVYDKIATLSTFPHRHALAQEDAFREYEIRRQIIGKYLALYSVDEEAKIVHVVGFRHGHRLPRPEELPQEPASGQDG